MTEEQKITWLEHATGEQLLKQYRSTLEKLDKAEVFSSEWVQLIKDTRLVEEEMLKRMGN